MFKCSPSNISFFLIVSSLIKSKPPSLYNSLGDLNLSLAKLGLLLILVTMPPSSSTAKSRGILLLSFNLSIMFKTSSLVLFLKSDPKKINPPKWYVPTSSKLSVEWCTIYIWPRDSSKLMLSTISLARS